MDPRAAISAFRRLDDADREILSALVTQIVLEVLKRLEVEGKVCLTGPSGTEGERTCPGSADEGRVHQVTGPVLVEDDVRRARDQGARTIRLGKHTLLSPLAVDAAREWGLELEREV